MPKPFPKRTRPAELAALAASENSTAAPLDAAGRVDIDVELIERRRFSRPIPIAQVQEMDGAEAWALWDQCTQHPESDSQGR